MKKVYWIFAMLTLLILTSCSVSSPAQTPTSNEEGAADYAWVLVDTIDYGASEEDIEKAHQYNVDYDFDTSNVDYEFEASAFSGNFSSTYIYIAGSESWDSSAIHIHEPRIHGTRVGAQASFSTPPNTIRAGETVVLSLSMSFTEMTLAGRRNARARVDFDFDYWVVGPGRWFAPTAAEFKNKDGEFSFYICYWLKVNRDDVNIHSLSETISATAPSGAQKGDKIAIHMRFENFFPLGTRYIYEWKAQ